MNRLLLIAILLLSSSLFAQEIKFNAQMRYRNEFTKNMSGFNSAVFGNTTAGNEFSFLRSRLGVSLTGSDNVSIFIQMQDARKFGEETNTLTDADADQFDLHQGFITIGDFLRNDMTLRVGRMEIILGNERLVGAVGWSNTARSFDGGLLQKKGENLSFSLFGVRVAEKTPNFDFDPDEDFYGFFASYNLSETRTFNGFMFLNWNSDRLLQGPDRNKNKLTRFTAGFDYATSAATIDYELEAAYQLGSQMSGQSSPKDDIRAYMLGIRLKFNLEPESKLFLGLGYDLLSGDADFTDDEYNAFNTLYATNHKYYGYMDYFTNIPQATSNLGLRDVILMGGLSPNEKVSISADWHYFSMAEDNSAGLRYLGSELDATLKYKYRKNLGLQLGGSFFVPGDIPKMAQDNDTKGFWTYLMLTYNFSN